MTNAPFRSSVMTVEPAWIDYNGHLNMAYYNVLFDRCADQIYERLGFGPDYLDRSGHTTFSAEFHVCYLRELHEGDRVSVTFHLVDFDEKRFHTYQEIWHEDGWCAATGEGLGLHIDTSGPRVAPMPQEITARLRSLHAAHAKLPKPDRISRAIAIKR